MNLSKSHTLNASVHEIELTDLDSGVGTYKVSLSAQNALGSSPNITVHFKTTERGESCSGLLSAGTSAHTHDNTNTCTSMHTHIATYIILTQTNNAYLCTFSSNRST